MGAQITRRSARHRALYEDRASFGALRNSRGGCGSGRLSRIACCLARDGGMYPRRWRAITLQYLMICHLSMYYMTIGNVGISTFHEPSASSPLSLSNSFHLSG